MHRQKQNGFSMVEILVALAIVGVLAMIAVPSYDRYVAKARMVEAKTSLSEIYTAEKLFYSEYSFYTYCLWQAGYRPDENAVRYYTTGYLNGIDDGCGVGSCWRLKNRGTAQCSPNPIAFGNSTRNDATFNRNKWANAALADVGASKNYSAGSRTFNAGAFGSVSRTARTNDVWEINQDGIIAHDVDGI